MIGMLEQYWELLDQMMPWLILCWVVVAVLRLCWSLIVWGQGRDFDNINNSILEGNIGFTNHPGGAIFDTVIHAFVSILIMLVWFIILPAGLVWYIAYRFRLRNLERQEIVNRLKGKDSRDDDVWY